jgi:hypothetical protein
MAELTQEQRDNLHASKFGLPESRSYPMPDREHAANAKARATQELARGHLTAAEKAKIDAKANKILSGGE